jgi:hypothetical protein
MWRNINVEMRHDRVERGKTVRRPRGEAVRRDRGKRSAASVRKQLQ